MTSSLVDDELFIARDDCAAAGPALLEKLGVCAVCDAISPATLVDLQEAATARLDEVLKYRSQHYAAGTMGNGVWKELCCRDGDRFDVHYRMSEAPFAALGTEGSWCAAVREILGADAKLLYTGQIVACGCDAIDADDEANQKWHMDGDHLDEVLYLPCHCLTVFVPLVDLCADNGATEFSLGSHKHECEDLGERVLECSAGSAIIFDYRTLHRGTANRTTADRPILYFTYSRSWFEDPVNYRHVNQHKSILEGGSEALADSLRTALFEAKIVVTGSVPLTAHQSIKIPEHIPLLVLRDPPGFLEAVSRLPASDNARSISLSTCKAADGYNP
jgi:ectoine hydroxylase-related dioxygenase (phytanoyl-CoA dioxygenase family)